MTLALFFILLYLMLQLGIGVWVSRRIRTEADYLIAGRSLGYTLATFSIFATWFGAETVVGSAGAAYTEGVSLGSAEPFGYGLCLILMGLIFAIPLWRRGLTTLADLFRQRYSVSVERVAAIILVPSSILWAAAQVRAFGQIISTASAWDVNLAIGVAALFTIAYTMFGGLLVDAITDVIQGVIVIVGLLVLFVVVIVKLGGVGGFSAALGESAGISVMPAAGVGWLDLAEAWAIPVFGSLLATELVGRVIATRTATVARNSSLLAGSMYLLVGLMPVLIGMAAVSFNLNVADAEQIIPLVARELLPTIVYAAFVGAIISAILSTVDSTLLTASGLLSHNLIVPIARITDERKKVFVARGGVLVFGIIAYTLALTAEGVFELVEMASALGSAGAFVVICFGLFTRFGGPVSAMTTLLVGVLGYLGLDLAGASYPFITSLLASLACYVVVGTMEKGTAGQLALPG